MPCVNPQAHNDNIRVKGNRRLALQYRPQSFEIRLIRRSLLVQGNINVVPRAFAFALLTFGTGKPRIVGDTMQRNVERVG